MKLSWKHKLVMHRHFSRLFRGYNLQFAPGIWTVEFAGRKIQIPLRPNRLWLDWDTALSICGHDIDVKQTYSALIESAHPPELFVDVGANYGTHSLLFLVHNIDTITFEPNPSCHDDFLTYCSLNGVNPRIEGIALGDREGVVDLWYPEDDTWLGSTDANIQSSLRLRSDVRWQKVTQRILDHYLREYGNRRLLIKVDTEGNELPVLKGGHQALKHCKTLVIFECWPGEEERRKLFEMFAKLQYKISELPWTQTDPGRLLTEEQFARSVATNFIAMPTCSLGSSSSAWECIDTQGVERD